MSPDGLDTTVFDTTVFDTTGAHQARIYDYWLGGQNNFAADREAAEQAIAAYPPILRAVRAQRAFLARAVRFLAERGVRQFLDIGTGIPTAGNTLLEPGLVQVHRWRPGSIAPGTGDPIAAYTGLARKP